MPDSPAARRPLNKGDFITAIDGHGITELDDSALLEYLHKTDDIVISMTRRGAGMLVPLTAAP